MKILITGGHLTPALAVIEQLKKEDVAYVGRRYTFEGEKAISLEYKQITSLNIPFFELSTGRLQRKITRHTLISLSKLPIGFMKAYQILRHFKPDVVLGFGSYISVPIGMVARLLGIPIVIHEQTLESGFANKILSRFADKVCISWETSRKFFPIEKTVLTGNPIRSEVLDCETNTLEKNLIYISGGSSGSHAVNVLIEKILDKLLLKFVIIHQTGDSQIYRDFDRLVGVKNTMSKKLADNYTPVKFLDTKTAAQTLSKACMFVGRAGINTVTELIYFKKSAILIPLEFSQKNEQLKNAQFLEKLGLAIVCEQNNLTPGKLYEEIINLSNNLSKFTLNKNILTENAADKIVSVLKDVYKQKSS